MGLKERLERFKAKAHGMTIPELRAHMAKRKAEKKALKSRLKAKERKEREKFEVWKIEQKYKQKRKQAKKSKSGGGLAMLEMLGGSGKSKGVGDDPLGLFGGSNKKTRRRKKR